MVTNNTFWSVKLTWSMVLSQVSKLFECTYHDSFKVHIRKKIPLLIMKCKKNCKPDTSNFSQHDVQPFVSFIQLESFPDNLTSIFVNLSTASQFQAINVTSTVKAFGCSI